MIKRVCVTRGSEAIVLRGVAEELVRFPQQSQSSLHKTNEFARSTVATLVDHQQPFVARVKRREPVWVATRPDTTTVLQGTLANTGLDWPHLADSPTPKWPC